MQEGLILLICFFFIIMYLFFYTKPNFTEYFEESFKKCEIPLILKEVLDQRNLQYNKPNARYYIPCTYDTCEREVRSLADNNSYKNTKIFLIDGCDVLASKLELWRQLKKYFGKEAMRFMPETYLLEELKDNQFREHFKKNQTTRSNHMYVLKNYKQRQEGIKLTSNLNEILNAVNNGWYLVQDYIYRPYIIGRRKINLRYYLLITTHNNKNNAYLYNDGFIYYTPEYYDDNDSNFSRHITTGYIDRQVYIDNPLTVMEFKEYIETINRGSIKIWDTNTYNLMCNVMRALDSNICNTKSLEPLFRFQIFGCDFAPDSTLGVKLMEINKGPDIGAKDERDKQVKRKLIEDVVDIVENTIRVDNGFTQLLYKN